MLLKMIAETLYEMPYKFFNGYAFPPFGVELLLTYRCNLNCVMCYDKSNLPPRKELSLEEIKDVVKQINSFNFFKSGLRIPHFELIGGEPFLRDDILDILKYISKTNMCSISTNASLLTDEICEELVKMKMHSIIISLDGPEKIHDVIRGKKGAYKKTVYAIEAINRYKEIYQEDYPKIILFSVILNSNADVLYKVASIAKKLKVDRYHLGALSFIDHRYSFNPSNILKNENLKWRPKKIESSILKKSMGKVKKILGDDVEFKFAPNSNEANMIEWYEGVFEIKDWKCTYPWRILRISPYGDVFPCLSIKVGNIREDKIKNIWNNKKFINFRRSLKNRGIFPSCSMCCNSVLKQ
jgi:MoaA/NifB/PqqE/SkfB family radical SAM enzyme